MRKKSTVINESTKLRSDNSTGVTLTSGESLEPGAITLPEFSSNATIIVNGDWSVSTNKPQSSSIDSDSTNTEVTIVPTTDDLGVNEIKNFINIKLNELSKYIVTNDYVIPDKYSCEVSRIVPVNQVYKPSLLNDTSQFDTYEVVFAIGNASVKLVGTKDELESQFNQIILGASLILSANLQIEE